MQKRAQISQLLGYLLIAIVLILALLFGYRIIKGMRERSEVVEITQLKTELESDIESIGRGSTTIETYNMPPKYKEVCFFDYSIEAFEFGPSEAASNALVNDAYYGMVKENMHLISNDASESYYIDSLKLTKPMDCIKVKDSKLKLKMEGKGAVAVVSELFLSE